MEVILQLSELFSLIPDFANSQREYRMQATTLGDVIGEIPKVVPFSLEPCVERGKYWIIRSEIKGIEGRLVDLHIIEPRSHLLTRDNKDRYTCPKHDLSFEIPVGGIVHLGHLIC